MNEEQKQTEPLLKTIDRASIIELKASAFDLQNQLQMIMSELQRRELVGKNNSFKPPR